MEYYCPGCHTEHWMYSDDSYDGCCPHCGEELSEITQKEIEAFLDS